MNVGLCLVLRTRYALVMLCGVFYIVCVNCLVVLLYFVQLLCEFLRDFFSVSVSVCVLFIVVIFDYV